MTARSFSEMMVVEVREVISAKQTCLERAQSCGKGSQSWIFQKVCSVKNLTPQKVQRQCHSENGVIDRLSIFLKAGDQQFLHMFKIETFPHLFFP